MLSVVSSSNPKGGLSISCSQQHKGSAMRHKHILKSDATDPTNRGFLSALSGVYCTDGEAQGLGALFQLQLQISLVCISQECSKWIRGILSDTSIRKLCFCLFNNLLALSLHLNESQGLCYISTAGLQVSEHGGSCPGHEGNVSGCCDRSSHQEAGHGMVGQRGRGAREVTCVVCPSSTWSCDDICVSSCVTKSGLSLKYMQFSSFQMIDKITTEYCYVLRVMITATFI